MTIAGDHANLGLPVPKSSRLRLVKRIIARFLWPFLRHQIALNQAVLHDIDELRGAFDKREERLETLASELRGVVLEVSGLRSAIESHEDPLKRFEEAFVDHNKLIYELQVSTHDLQTAVHDLLVDVQKVRGLIDLGQRQAGERIDRAEQSSIARYEEANGALRRDLAEVSIELARFSAELGHVANAAGRQYDAVRTDIDRRLARLGAALDDQRFRFASVDLLMREVRRALPDPPHLQTLAALPSSSEATAVAIERALEEPRALVRERLRTLLPLLVDASQLGFVVDLECGSGDWLAELVNVGIPAYGVEANKLRAEEAAAQGIDVRIEPPIDHLRSVPRGTLGAATALGFISHLSVDEVIELVDLLANATASGGVLVIDGPNPDNLIVGASGFYASPLNRRPLPSQLLTFLLETHGFSDVVVSGKEPDEHGSGLQVPLPETSPWARDLIPIVRVLNERLFAGTSYTVVARRS